MALGLAGDVEDRSRSLLAERFNHCFLVGDLNYRLELDVNAIKQMLAFAEMLDLRRSDAPSKAASSSQGAPSSEEDQRAQEEADLTARVMRMEIAQIGVSQAVEVEDRDSGDEKDDDEEDEDESARGSTEGHR